MSTQDADEERRLLERKLHQADNRIADLESLKRRAETYENERAQRLAEANRTIIELRREALELEARIREHHVNSNDAAQTAERACAKLLLWEPVVLAAREVRAALIDGNLDADNPACSKLATALDALDKVPSA